MNRISSRFFVLLGLALLAACAGYAALVLSSATWAEARALDLIFPFYGLPIRTFTETEYAAARNGLAVSALLLGVAAIIVGNASSGTRELQALRREVSELWTGLINGLKALSARQRRQAGGALAFLTVLRLYF